MKMPGKRAQVTGARRVAFRSVAVILSLAAVVLIELVLRAFGWGGYSPIIRQVGVAGDSAVMITDPEGSRCYFFANPNNPGSFPEGCFSMPKPPGTVRVFLFGGSVIRGYPQPRPLTPSSFLEAMLKDVLPGTEVEVVNFGTTAVASFPVLDMLEQALPYDPDLVVIYAGHNEFFGAYGTASSQRAGGRPWMFRLQHRVRELGIVQAIDALVHRNRPIRGVRLMEAMVGESTIGPRDGRRDNAARNLAYHIGRIIRRCDEADVPVLVCTLPSNERDLIPIGEDWLENAGDHAAAEASRRLDSLSEDWTNRPEDVEEELRRMIESQPLLARAHYFLGKALYERGDFAWASRQFVLARDLDTMPWRATTLSQEALRTAVEAEGAHLCDVEAVFREHSPGGAIGWDLMDDHVHPSLRGQALIAEAIVRCLPDLPESECAIRADVRRIRPWNVYADVLGDNPFDGYAVARRMRDFFAVGFLSRHNRNAHQRFTDITARFEADQSEETSAFLQKWEGGEPITLAVARERIRRKEYEEALPLLRITPDLVPLYTLPHMDYVFVELKCAYLVHGQLSEEDQSRARAEIERGRLLLRTDLSEPWNVQRIIGWLLCLLGQHDEAIPYLVEAQRGLKGVDRIANDRELVVAYIETGRADKAREIADRGARHSGQHSPVYRELADFVDEWALQTNSTVDPERQPALR